MRILVFADNHFSEKSSILVRYGTRYTMRLENQLDSLRWVGEQAVTHKCDCIVGLGDFFDHAQLTDQELTALQEVPWADLPHYFLVGNHESEECDLQYNSTMALQGPNRTIISKPSLVNISDTLELAFLPYVLESNRQPIDDYFDTPAEKLRILFSHNDIQGLQLGPVVSRTGFTISDLEQVCHLCVNGHLHNGQQISNKIVNLGNLTGKDFSEDATNYLHKIMIIDTDLMQVDYFENPYALNFYKFELINTSDLEKLYKLKSNALVAVKCTASLIPTVREICTNQPNIIESRIMVLHDQAEDIMSSIDISSLCVDQCAKFAECCRAKLENSELLEQELAEILK